MNIIIEDFLGGFEIHTQKLVKDFDLEKIKNIDGVSSAYQYPVDPYEMRLHIGKAFDAEKVLLEVQAEILKQL